MMARTTVTATIELEERDARRIEAAGLRPVVRWEQVGDGDGARDGSFTATEALGLARVKERRAARLRTTGGPR